MTPGFALRMLAVVSTLAALLAFMTPARAGDPYLRWSTLETPHFRVHYHSGLERVAQRVATLCEAIYGRLAPNLGWEPAELTHVVLTDATDAANGSAGVVPYNQVRLFVTAPDDMSALTDYDDWMLTLVTHEQTHILQVDNATGIPALVNALVGKRYVQNQGQPRFILEGLAVAMESMLTSGGRLRSTQFDMYLRADVLEDNFAGIDQVSNYPFRWPRANLWYLYGSKFISWILEAYGPAVYSTVARDYGAQVVPWGINRSLRRATGSTYADLYQAWHRHLKEKYGRQRDLVAFRGRIEGRRLTQRGEVARSPRFYPARCTSDPALIYFRDDGHTTPGLYRLALRSNGDERAPGASPEGEIVTRASTHGLSFDPDCGIIFDSVAPTRRRYSFIDVFRQEPGTTSPRGVGSSRKRLTFGERARDPDVSPDGRKIVYVTNHAGTSTLMIAELDDEYRVHAARPLVPSAEFEQAYTPRFSPDGRAIAYSVWTEGGYRDIRVVDVESGRFFELFHDRALDQQPSWSADGARIFFTSDRTGIANVYAYDLETRRLRQVTNVVNGAYMPEVSPDGRTLVYVGYTALGFDLYALALDPKSWLEPLEYTDPHPGFVADPAEPFRPAERYSPWATLRPRVFRFELGEGTFGQSLALTTTGADIAGLHSFGLSLTLELEEFEARPSLDYSYQRLPFDLRVSAFRSAAPRKDYRYGEDTPVFTERSSGITSGVEYTIPGEYQNQTVALSYSFVHLDQTLPVGTRADPFSEVTIDPRQGFLGAVHLGYTYNDTESTEFGTGPEKGFRLSLSTDLGAPELASDYTLTSFSGRLVGYFLVPGLAHHVVALAASAGTAVGSYPTRGLYHTGGFVDEGILSDDKNRAVIDAFTSGIRQSGFVLRGYLPGQFVGTQYNLLNFEYRFPVAHIDRGLSTLPVFFRDISATLFADYGGAYNEIDLEDPLQSLHLGLGAELWFEMALGYFGRSTVRLGAARGTDNEAPGLRTYFVAASTF